MFKAHASQEPRPNGEAYINHPLRVALRSITEFGVITCDGICAALLHDSVEDQASTLIRIEGDNPTTISPDSWSSAALGVIGERFGASCARMVALLTNPDFDVYAEGAKEAGDTREVVDIKNEAYFRHFFEISEADEEAFKIKLADFSENALSIQNLEAGSKKDKLCKKYGPVLKEVIRLLSAPETPIHVSETFLNRAITIYDSCYKEALSDRASDPRDTQS